MDTHLFVGLAGYLGRPEEEGAVVVHKSITKGTCQHVLDCNDAHVIYVHPNSANYIFAGTDDGIWRSTDKDLTFENANVLRDGVGIWSFLTLEDNPDVIFAGGPPIEPFKSADSGKIGPASLFLFLKSAAQAPFLPRSCEWFKNRGSHIKFLLPWRLPGPLKQ